MVCDLIQTDKSLKKSQHVKINIEDLGYWSWLACCSYQPIRASYLAFLKWQQPQLSGILAVYIPSIRSNLKYKTGAIYTHNRHNTIFQRYSSNSFVTCDTVERIKKYLSYVTSNLLWYTGDR
jgi:hypothetical protein